MTPSHSQLGHVQFPNSSEVNRTSTYPRAFFLHFQPPLPHQLLHPLLVTLPGVDKYFSPQNLLLSTSPSSKTKIREYLTLTFRSYIPSLPIYKLRLSYTSQLHASGASLSSPWGTTSRLVSNFIPHSHLYCHFQIPSPPALTPPGKERGEILSIYCLLFSCLQAQISQVESRAGRMWLLW